MNRFLAACHLNDRSSSYLPLFLMLLAVALWIDKDSVPTLVARLLPLAAPQLDGPCTGAPIPC